MRPPRAEDVIRLFTIGHSNRSFEDFLPLLKECGVRAVVDIRRYPSSRRFPHFNRDALAERLMEEGIEYLWLETLGGRRHGRQDGESPNTGLTSPGFRNYADYMMTAEFRTGVEKLLSTASKLPAVILCAEKLYWKCHRRLLGDYLVAHGVAVEHILDPGRRSPHKLTGGAVVTACGDVTYPSGGKSDEPDEQGLFRDLD